jgi:hypothetical protein
VQKTVTFRITLKDITPAIWRTFKVDEEEDLFSLHQIIQVVMGWENAHLFEFNYGKRRIGLVPDEDELWDIDEDVEDSEAIALSDLSLKVGDKLGYLYDFGDSWEHLLEVVEIREEVLELPLCLDGARGCPPEDCGGIPGYISLQEVLKNPAAPDYDEMLDWIGEDFDPEFFDLEEANELLQDFNEWRNSLDSEDFDNL